MSPSGERPFELHFVTSATDWRHLPATGQELAVVGRSNVGKSSLINRLANRRELAQVSKTPGRTRLINLYALGPSRAGDGAIAAALVDLPGYGYAAVSGATKRSWPAMIERYLLERPSLEMVAVLVDAEVGPTPLDLQMLGWIRHHTITHTVVAAKADKVRPSKVPLRRSELSRACGLDVGDVCWVSSLSGAGVDDLRRRIRLVLADRG